MEEHNAVMPPQTFCWPVVTALYPVLDAVGKQIVEALLARDLRAGPHIGRLSHYGDRDAHFYALMHISGPGYEVELRRPQGRIGGNGRVAERCAGVSRVTCHELDEWFFGGGVDEWTEQWVTMWLREHVLKEILHYPEVPGALLRLTDPPPVAYPSHLPPLITACDPGSARTFAESRQAGVPVVRRRQMVTLQCLFSPEGIEPTLAMVAGGLLQHPSPGENRVIQIKPWWANCMAVIETAEYHEAARRQGPQVTLGALDALLEAMLDGAVGPDRYDGDFHRPIVLLQRHLAPTEVEVLERTWPALRQPMMPHQPRVIGEMLREASTEFERAVTAWLAYLRSGEVYDELWVEVNHATKALAVALSDSRKLVRYFVGYQARRTYTGEPARAWLFASDYARWEALIQLREETR